MNSTATMRHEGATQAGPAEEESRGLDREADGAHPGLDRRMESLPIRKPFFSVDTTTDIVA